METVKKKRRPGGGRKPKTGEDKTEMWSRRLTKEEQYHLEMFLGIMRANPEQDDEQLIYLRSLFQDFSVFIHREHFGKRKEELKKASKNAKIKRKKDGSE